MKNTHKKILQQHDQIDVPGSSEILRFRWHDGSGHTLSPVTWTGEFLSSIVLILSVVFDLQFAGLIPMYFQQCIVESLTEIHTGRNRGKLAERRTSSKQQSTRTVRTMKFLLFSFLRSDAESCSASYCIPTAGYEGDFHKYAVDYRSMFYGNLPLRLQKAAFSSASSLTTPQKQKDFLSAAFTSAVAAVATALQLLSPPLLWFTEWALWNRSRRELRLCLSHSVKELTAGYC